MGIIYYKGKLMSTTTWIGGDGISAMLSMIKIHFPHEFNVTSSHDLLGREMGNKYKYMYEISEVKDSLGNVIYGGFGAYKMKRIDFPDGYATFILLDPDHEFKMPKSNRGPAPRMPITKK